MKWSAIVLVVAALGLSACANGSKGGAAATPTPSFAQFSDIPVPPKATMDVERSLLLGHGETWTGRLIYSSWSQNESQLYDLYHDDMPKFGWQEITSVRAAISIQTWQRGSRVCTIQFKDDAIGGEVILTMTPMGGGGGAMPAGGGYDAPAAPAPAAAPPAPVTKSNLD